MIQWLNHLRLAFGASFLWLVCSIYFTQGFRSFVWTAVSYQLKDKLELSPSASQFVSTVAFFPWSIKPLYGILSDCIPIGGRKRIPYLVISTVLSLFPWLVLGQLSSLRDSKVNLMSLLMVQNLGSAMADVVVDAMIAEAVKLERASFAGDLQALSWMSMAVGGICGSLLGGYALTNLRINNIFLLFSILPAVQLFSCIFVEEKKVLSTSSVVTTHMMNGSSKSEDFEVEKSASTILRRKKSGAGKKKNKKSKLPKDSSVKLHWYQSLKTACYSLYQAFRQPIIMRSMTWFMIANVAIPNLSTVMFYYQTEYLNLEASFLGTARVAGWLGLMLGTFVYNRFLKNMKLRKILMWAHVGVAITNLVDIFLVSRVNERFGISDKALMLCGSTLADAINQFKFMPFLILSGQLCPPGIEGTLFALFMSINNLSSTLGSFAGAGLASILNLSSGSFENLVPGLAIQTLCTLIPIAFLFLIPKEATGIST
ncbi:probable folate-biopterin transporter 4 [Impatiens glandulifera]|uniref:probable folate-biopterin transporter 4 n=1 Tax=Impatiens glandulifera TaxID=253017 RepID=UPI001FB104A5|nr:probable folate-biopterin transporter 4 [Impatiens glandulifera]